MNDNLPHTPLGVAIWAVSALVAYVAGRNRKRRRLSAVAKKRIAAAKQGKVFVE